MAKYYTVFVDDELWVDIIDDMYSNSSWAMNGMIFTDIEPLNDFINNLREYDDWKDSKITIKEVVLYDAAESPT